MTEDEKKEPARTGFSDILKALGGGAGIAAIIAVIINAQNSKSPTSPAPPPNGIGQSKSFVVQANDTRGYPYQYPNDKKSATIKYEAVGNWQGIPIGTQEKVATGPINTDGYSGFAPSSDRPCRDSNIGALVVRTASGKCITGGQGSSFMAEPGTTYYFLMNDVNGKYDDNSGSTEVTLHFSP
jgi:hypothetical protein